MVYDSLRGTLTYVAPPMLAIEVQGVGYRLLAPSNCFDALPRVGEELCLLVSHQVRENSQQLFGFLTRQERDLYERLIAFRGVGPKTGLSLIGTLSPPELYRAVREQDVKALCRVPGIGKRGAERLLVEMKDELLALIALTPEIETGRKVSPSSPYYADALNALVNLGYTQRDARESIERVLASAPAPVDLSELITRALKGG